MPISLFEVREKDGLFLAGLGNTWSDLEFEVALDSGIVIHVCARAIVLAILLHSRRAAGGVRSSSWDGGMIPDLRQTTRD